MDVISDVRTSKSHSNPPNMDTVPPLASTSKVSQATSIKIPDSPPPAYENIKINNFERNEFESSNNSFPPERQTPGKGSIIYLKMK